MKKTLSVLLFGLVCSSVWASEEPQFPIQAQQTPASVRQENEENAPMEIEIDLDVSEPSRPRSTRSYCRIGGEEARRICEILDYNNCNRHRNR